MYFTIYKDKAGEYRWTLYSANHEKIADSAEGYTYKSGAQHGIGLVMSTNTNTPVFDRS